MQDAERRAQTITRNQQRHLAEITNLRAALRDAMARSDQAAIIGKLHLDVDHLRCDVACGKLCSLVVALSCIWSAAHA